MSRRPPPAPNHPRAIASRLALIPFLLLATPQSIVGSDPAQASASTSFEYIVEGMDYPVIYPHEVIRFNQPVQLSGTFSPLFGKDRPFVNPGSPELIGDRTLRFPQPGEYYLDLGEARYLKVLVLDPDSNITDNVLRLFDFLVANLLVSDGEQNVWDNLGPGSYVRRWFLSPLPGQLLCGPSDAFFRMLVAHRFALPNRMATLPGVTRLADGTILYATHNVSEIYLPEIGQFVVFDLNNNFVPQWLDALGVAKALAQALAENHGLANENAFDLARLNIRYSGVIPYRPSNWRVLEAGVDAVPFSEDMVSDTRVREVRKMTLLLTFSGGVAYFGQSAYGTGFLPKEYVFAPKHSDQQLSQRALDWVRSYGLDPIECTPDELRAMLKAGFEKEIAAAVWRSKLPAKPHVGNGVASGKMPAPPGTGRGSRIDPN